jgi:pimeloyl-ACP methyl ester carboxylesterase
VAGIVYADAAGTVKVSKEEADRFLAGLRANKHDVLRQWWAPILKNASDAVKNAALSSADRTPVEVFVGSLQSMLAFDVGKALSSYHGPKLAIAAGAIENPASLHVQFPKVPTKKIDGTSHWLQMDKPEEFNRLLDEFLAGVR